MKSEQSLTEEFIRGNLGWERVVRAKKEWTADGTDVADKKQKKDPCQEADRLMKPSIIATEYRKGNGDEHLSAVLFVGCAEEWEIEDVLKEIPESMQAYFEKFVADAPLKDMPILRLRTRDDFYVLRKEWFQRFKDYYAQQSSP